MKTNIYTLLLIISIFFSPFVGQATSIDFDTEEYIDDIPFSTEQIVHDHFASKFEFEEETYIDDIPFKTDELSNHYKYLTSIAIEFYFEEESYVDDIPFDTQHLIEQKENKTNLGLIIYQPQLAVLF